MIRIGHVGLHSAELIKWQKSTHLTINFHICTVSLQSITVNSSDRRNEKEDNVGIKLSSSS